MAKKKASPAKRTAKRKAKPASKSKPLHIDHDGDAIDYTKGKWVDHPHGTELDEDNRMLQMPDGALHLIHLPAHSEDEIPAL